MERQNTKDMILKWESKCSTSKQNRVAQDASRPKPYLPPKNLPKHPPLPHRESRVQITNRHISMKDARSIVEQMYARNSLQQADLRNQSLGTEQLKHHIHNAQRQTMEPTGSRKSLEKVARQLGTQSHLKQSQASKQKQPKRLGCKMPQLEFPGFTSLPRAENGPPPVPEPKLKDSFSSRLLATKPPSQDRRHSRIPQQQYSEIVTRANKIIQDIFQGLTQSPTTAVDCGQSRKSTTENINTKQLVQPKRESTKQDIVSDVSRRRASRRIPKFEDL